IFPASSRRLGVHTCRPADDNGRPWVTASGVLRPPQPGTPAPNRGPEERWLIMWKSLPPVLFGLSLVLTVPALASDPADRTILPGGCVVQTVEIKGKLFWEWVTDSRPSHPPICFQWVWKLTVGGKTYELDFDRNQKLQELAGKLDGRTVVVTGILDPTRPTLRVIGLRADEYFRKTVQVEIKGKLRFDPMENLKPFGVYWYIPIGGQRYYLNIGQAKGLEKMAADL